MISKRLIDVTLNVTLLGSVTLCDTTFKRVFYWLETRMSTRLKMVSPPGLEPGAAA